MNVEARGAIFMTYTEKILAKGCKRRTVRPGEIVEVEADRMMIHDNNAALVIGGFNKIVAASVLHPERAVFVIDHHSPATSIKAAGHQAEMRRFAEKHGIGAFYDCGCGISHVVMLEDGLAGPGEIVIGTDSHTTGEGAMGAFATGVGATEMAALLVTGRIWLKVPETVKVVLDGTLPDGVDARDLMSCVLERFGPEGANYRAVEFHGAAARAMQREERIMCCVMCMEMGAKNALFADDEPEDASYARTERFNAAETEPMVAVPPSPTNARPLREVELEKIRIDQAFIGSCAGGLLRDLEAAARTLEGHSVASHVRLLVAPASRRIYAEALDRGYLKTLHEAGAVISSPACGACGAHDCGAIAEGEVCIADSPRNMKGRMGPGGTIYLASAATTAASALKGYVASPGGE